jgi:ketosteroid isomerase-like protein
MSQENVEIVRRLHSLLEQRDWLGMTDLLDPNVEMYGTVGGIGEGQLVARGLGQIRAVIELEDDEIWDEHRWEPQELIDAGDRVVVLQREYQRGKGSGVELVVDTATILDLRDERVVRMQGYVRPKEALEAVGLSAEPFDPP